MLLIHLSTLLNCTLEGEAAESIDHCVSFEQILKTLFGNSRVISSNSISCLTKGMLIQLLDSKGLFKDIRACSRTLHNLEVLAELNRPTVINAIAIVNYLS